MADPLTITILCIEGIGLATEVGVATYGAVESHNQTEKAKKEQRRTKKDQIDVKVDNADARIPNSIPIAGGN
jgi:hypothetical protein